MTGAFLWNQQVVGFKAGHPVPDICVYSLEDVPDDTEKNDGITLIMANHVDLLPSLRSDYALTNLKHTLDCAGVGMAGLTQALIYVMDREHLALVNQVYAEYVTEPYPNRAAIIVSGFARPEMLVEIVAYGVT